jgi:NAD(P)-dependent dehydrogenase (short-subunit alcohol dehydrogenase family)
MSQQRVLITAGASGIGKEIARAFLETGAAVFVNDIDMDALAVIERELPGVKTAVCDMASRAEIERMVPAAVDALGGLDVLVNNAGIAGPTVPVEEFDPDEWDRVVQVNLTGTFNVTRLAIPYLKQSPAGSIIIMSSVAGRFGYPNRSAYSATKWGLIGFTKTLSRELGEFGVRANAILPGAVDGPRLQGVYQARAAKTGQPLDEVKAAAMALQSLKRLVDPRDIAALAVFLASDAAKSISGQSFPVDNDMQAAS